MKNDGRPTIAPYIPPSSPSSIKILKALRSKVCLSFDSMILIWLELSILLDYYIFLIERNSTGSDSVMKRPILSEVS